MLIDCKKAAIFYCLLIMRNSLEDMSKRSDMILCIFLGKISGKNSSPATVPTKENIFSLKLETGLL